MKDNTFLFWLLITMMMITTSRSHHVSSTPLAVPEYPSWSLIDYDNLQTLEDLKGVKVEIQEGGPHELGR